MMRKSSLVLSTALALAGVTGTVGILLVPSVAMAQQKVSAKVGVPLKAAQDAAQKKKWDVALAKIKEADGAPGKTSFDQYKINELMLYVYFQQGRYADATRVLEAQLASGQMPAGEKPARTKTLAQLYFRAGNYAKAASIAKTLPGDRDMQLMVVQCAYKQNDYKGAVAAADRLMKGGGQPSQELLQIVLRSNYELKDSAGTTRALEQLLKYYPSTDTWDRVLDGYFQSEKHDDGLMALYRLSEDVGTLTKPRQYTDMAQVLILGGFGIEGERIIQKGFAANLFAGDDLSRAQRTLDAAKKKADAERALLPKAPAMLAAAKTGDETISGGQAVLQLGRLRQGHGRAEEGDRQRRSHGRRCGADAARRVAGTPGQQGRGGQGVRRDQGSEVCRDRQALQDGDSLIRRLRRRTRK